MIWRGSSILKVDLWKLPFESCGGSLVVGVVSEILENIDIDIDIDKEILENIDIDKGILQNIDIDKISYQ